MNVLKITFIKRLIQFSFLVIALLFINNSYSQGLGVNTTGAAADPSAMLDISSNNSGLLIPRMTQTERDAINNPVNGLMLINTTNNCLEIFFAPNWQSIFCGCPVPNNPIPATHIVTQNQITWLWNNIPNSTGFKYNFSNDYSTAIDIQTDTSFVQTGLVCNTYYTLYLWAYNSCGESNVVILNATTAPCSNCGMPVTFNYLGNSVTYNSVLDNNNRCWLDRNLGAVAVATAFNHTDSYGDLFQWGRESDGHQIRTSPLTPIQSSNTSPSHDNFIYGLSNWYNGANPDDLWQGSPILNNPCPNGWRVPTQTEFDDEGQALNGFNNNTAMLSALKLPAAGFREYPTGNVGYQGQGHYWTSTVDGQYSFEQFILDTHAYFNPTSRAFGMSVRCIQD